MHPCRDRFRFLRQAWFPATVSFVKVHLVQPAIVWEDKQANRLQVRELLHGAGVEPGDFILLPEMFDTGFSFTTSTTADQDGSTIGFLRELAAATGACVQGGRTRAGEHAANVMSVLAPKGTLLAEYQKIHPFSYANEDATFAGGDEVVVFAWGGLRFCPAICYDLRFPELFRMGLLAGAEAFAIGACWPRPRHDAWRALLVARAMENQAWVLGCNRTGDDPRLEYAGGSIVIGPRGNVVGELGSEPGVLSVPIDPNAVGAWRAAFPAWKDIRLIQASPGSGTGVDLGPLSSRNVRATSTRSEPGGG